MAYNLCIYQRTPAHEPEPRPPYCASFDTPWDRLTACVNQLTFSELYPDITPEHARIIEKVAVAVSSPDDALKHIAALCAEWGVCIELLNLLPSPILQNTGQLTKAYGSPGPERLYAVITEHDGKTGMELFATPDARRASLLERISNVRESDGPVPARFADDDEKLALLLTALLLPDEVRLAESVWDPELVFYRPDPSRS